VNSFSAAKDFPEPSFEDPPLQEDAPAAAEAFQADVRS